MSKISEAIGVIDKATKGWEIVGPDFGWYEIRSPRTKYGRQLIADFVARPKEGIDALEFEANAKLALAAPEMAEWIKEALPWMEAYANEKHIVNMHSYQYVSGIDALIAEAKGEGHV